MPNKKLLGVLFDTETSRAKAVHLDDSLESFYKALHCTTIDIVGRTVGDKHFNIVCDDEALLQSDCRISGITPFFEATLFGSLFVVGPCDEVGNLTSLTKADVKHILSHCHPHHQHSDFFTGRNPMTMLVCTNT